MQAKREKRYRNGDQVVEEDEPERASAEHNKWRNNVIKKSLLKSVDAAATDHSTIMTNPMHSERALAYDVAVGVCDISQPTLYDYRLFADWRFQEKLDRTEEKIFKMYFIDGKVDSIPLSQWIKDKKNGVDIPINIIDTR